MALQRERGALSQSGALGEPPPPALTARHVAELCAELSPIVAGSLVADVRGLPPRDVLCVLEPQSAGGPRRRLRLSAGPDAPRFHLQEHREPRHAGPVGPFFQRLADELRGAELRSVAPVRGDRIALLELATEAGRRALVLELFGRHANLALLGPGDVVRDVLVPLPEKASGARRLAPGAVWAPPPLKDGRAGAGADPGPSLAEALGAGEPGPPSEAPLSELVERVLGGHAEAARTGELRRDLAQRLARRIERTEALLAGLARKADAGREIERARQDAELVKAALGSLPRGLASVELDDWYAEGTPKRRIELDPRRSPAENVERLFARVQKLERGVATAGEEIARARAKLAQLAELAERLAGEDADPVELEREATERSLLEPRQVADPRKRKAPPPRRPYKTFRALHGAEIRVGRSARDNDELTLRHSRGNDVWLHTADVPGSHVVLRVERGPSPRGAAGGKDAPAAHPEDVLDAAVLAVHFSPARGKDRVPVHVAPRKLVSKPKGAKPGLVRLSGGKTLTVRADPARLERLLRGEQGAPE